MARRPRLAVLSALAIAAGMLPPLLPGPAGAATGLRWERTVTGGWFQWSSPAVADVNGDGRNDVVVGGLDGKVYAWDADGNTLPGWPKAATASVASSPAVGDLDGDGRPEVVVGTGSLEKNDRGAINIFHGDGTRCDLPTNTGKEGTAVINSAAIGDVTGDGLNDVVYGAFDHIIRVVDDRCRLLGSFDNRDSVFSAPALADVDGDGAAEIFIGGDATENGSVAGDSHHGGYFRSLVYRSGHSALGQTNLAQRWQRISSEAFQSAAAIGDVDGNGRLEVVTGTGAYYCRHTSYDCRDSKKVWAFHLDDGSDVPGWPKAATFEATYMASPALGDVDGDGRTDVAFLTNQYNQNHPSKVPNGGAVEVFFGNGSRDSYVAKGDVEIMTPPVIADINGGLPEILVSDAGKIIALNQNLDVVGTGFAPDLAHKSAVAVGDLRTAAAPDTPRWALVTAGFSFPPARPDGTVHVYDISTPASAPWPQFQKNGRRLGNDAVDLVIDCRTGYWMVGGDGGIFSFGSGYFGSTGNVALNQPIKGMAAAPGRDGYWFVASDGGIFNYGPGAGFHGSTGDVALNKPIVGMATHPSGKGYWLVASDGGIFNFGQARFHGSTGDVALNSPIVGMAATKTGGGYWLVAADGGIFSFGDAGFHGSTGDVPLNSPIVGMAATKTGGGYWFVAADGGIFSFGDAGFFGSAGGTKVPSPIVGMRATPAGNGYWFATAAGRIYRYGDADYCGALTRRPNSPVVGIA